ncbi:glycosyl transferase family 2 [Patiriisocius marinistellae]|uniref:Glycosyl transferase family 2 n=1 Tax=Patiriisocius marinistellae TaxID=2494560 RepID=A0A5J4FYW1_9FLAO|nr:glycosyltransferase family 2 protein [Patiriisocius marinistellae]GEQ86588.1 glycosyl transferase family 2 [Patiriisocius marinistellae]
MKIAVVILNWNGQKLLEKFLPSVLSFSKEATIYVADNASTDTSIAFTTEMFPSVQIIKNHENGGYAKGYNDALAHLTEDIFVLLNSDVEVTENWLTPIISAFKKHENLVAAQPKILDFKNKAYFEYAGAAGGYIDNLGYPYCRGRIFETLEKDEGQYDDNTEIFWATGACLFIRKNAFVAAGGFDEDLFAHQEEIDLCWRLQSNGGIIKYFGSSKVYHVGGATLAAGNPKKTFYNFRNSLLVLFKNIEGVKIYRILFLRMILDGIAAFKFLLEGKPSHFVSIFKAHISFYSHIWAFFPKRKKWKSTFQYAKNKHLIKQYFINKRKTFKMLK